MRLTDVKWNPGVYYSEEQDHTTKIDYFYLSNNIFMPSRHFSTYAVSSGFYFDLRHIFITNRQLKWYYDQKITLIFSSDFETMFVKHSPSEIISLNFEKKTVNLNCTFPF